MIRRLQSALTGIERAVTSVAVICLFAIMLIVVADVFMRYAVNRPFSFTYDLVGLYLMAGLTRLPFTHMSASIFSCIDFRRWYGVSARSSPACVALLYSH